MAKPPPKAQESKVLIIHLKKIKHPPYKIYNIGNNNPVQLVTFIATIEKALQC